jgi:phage shock protein PspC (stress-responsive transcriptional regulator)
MAAAARHGRLVPMSEQENAGPRGLWEGQGPGPEQGPDSARPPLRRDGRSRMIAGVCGGLGRHLDIDPVVFRILFALLTFFGGFGLLAYAAAWLFVPDDGESESEARKLLSGRSTVSAVAVAVLAALGFMVMVTVLGQGFGRAIPLLLLAAAIVAVLLWLGERERGTPGQAQFTGGLWGPAGAQQPRPWWQRPVSAPPAPGAGGDTVAPDAAEPQDAVGEFGAPQFTEPPAVSVPRRRPRRVNGLTLSAALLALGVVGVLAEAGAISIGWSAGLALAVMAVGAGMIVGGLFGRARALIPLGLVLVVPLILASAIDVPLRGETGDTTWTPASAAVLASPYNLATGRGELDLSAIDPGGGTVHVTAYVGAGQLIVTVPDDVALQAVVHVGAGRMQFVDGEQRSGLDVTSKFDSSAEGGSKGTIVLDLKAGLGDVEVQRVH